MVHASDANLEVHVKKLVAPILVATMAAFALTGCSPDSQAETSDSNEVVATNSVEAGTIIDVRTPEEFAEGHLQDAVNIDVSDPGFEDAISDLDPNGQYTVYCRSGNRSAQAVAIMQQNGFTNVTDAGGMADAATALDIEIVK
jgi:phage shock protein E